jgi:pimeloyl-ACP methyl ester carboxylesterase
MATIIQPTHLCCETTGLHYLEAGSGDTAIVFVHGWSAFKEIWWSALLALAPYAHGFAPDLPGHGGSVQHPAGGMAEIAGCLADFCAARGLPKVTLVGHSMGGNIAVELALARPDLVQRLMLVNPALQGSAMPGFTRSYLRPDHGWLALRASIALANQISQFSTAIPHQHGGGMVIPIVRRLGYMARHDPELLHRLLGAMFRNPLLPRLPLITQPTLMIAGQLDPLVPVQLTRQAARAIPGAKLQLMPRAAHNPMDEQPALFESILLGFLGYRPTAL